ncbi:MAG: ribonucleoside-diphosphate reductase alpha chain [Candidatus Berkelbacteria bacterium Licking1014_2]|uniref:Vitamin B12-dependent ribonucleotide reductase n=1 Tax=Candidatus Berkelbacteria bacterium Licking1014_2 TaxID=2017146 RepID=A0A554LV62_9BACT|nr:MAG: ribonucleoside-diphosphate reductase alpha chain [Candidatus Berkelbacteria bacterium Licking1014_2]
MVDWQKIIKTAQFVTKFLDNVINVNKYLLPEIEKMTKNNRKIGLGVMGLADLLIDLEIPYNSQEALDLSEKLAKTILQAAKEESQRLAKKQGAFPNFSQSVFKKQPPRRNATLTTIAPTGTISIIAGSSSGIEPLFALCFVRNVMDNDRLLEVNPAFAKIAKDKEFYSDELMEKISQQNSVQEIEEIPKKYRRIFVTSHDISPEWHVKMQAVWQRYTDNAVSKTINFPHSASREDVAEAYLLAYKLKCKGLTVYRDGSRETQVLSTGQSGGELKKSGEILPADIHPRKRPEILLGKTVKSKTAYGNLYVTINEDEKQSPFEVFAQMGKAGGFFAATAEAISRLVSLALRSNIDPQEIIDQLKGIRDPMPIWSKNGQILSLPDAIAKTLDNYLKDKKSREEGQQLELEIKNLPKPQIADMGMAPACPECAGVLEMTEGCLKCQHCGYSQCG